MRYFRDALPNMCWGYRDGRVQVLCVDHTGRALQRSKEPYSLVIGPGLDAWEADQTLAQLGTRTRP